MLDKIDQTIETLTGVITRTTKSEDAIRFTQSVLNLTHAKANLMAIEADEAEKTKFRTKGASA